MHVPPHLPGRWIRYCTVDRQVVRILQYWKKYIAAADPGFPKGSAKICRKLRKNDENRTGGVHPKFHYVDPPLHCLCLVAIVMKHGFEGTDVMETVAPEVIGARE